MKMIQDAFDKVITWAKEGSRWRWVLAVFALAVLAIPLSLLLFRRPVQPSHADVDLKSTIEQEEIRKEVQAKNDNLSDVLRKQQEEITRSSQKDSDEKLRQDTLKEMLND